MNDCSLQARRSFLKFLAGSPLLGALRPALARGQANPRDGQAIVEALGASNLIESPQDAVNVFDFEPVARAELDPAHWGYLKTGVDDDGTIRANREAFSRLYIRPRRLVGVTKIDMTTRLFGAEWETPIALAPVGSQNAFHEEGEIAVAKAARSTRHLQILSTVTTHSVEDVIAARGGPIWYQLYPTSGWQVTRALLRRAKAAGCPVVVVTVDQVTSRNRETLRRFRSLDTRNCRSCHAPGLRGYLRRKPMFDGLDVSGINTTLAPALTWDDIRRMRDETDLKLVLKGIVTREDAERSVEVGVDGLIVSNHGGRSEESNWASLDSLPEVVKAVRGRVPVLVDGGFRRGTDVFKALALGAKAVCIGRPYIWGLAAFGQEGVEAVLRILRSEFEVAMMTMGATRVQDINASFIGRTAR